MLNIAHLPDSTALLSDPAALRARYEEEGVLLLRGLIDRDLLRWAEGEYRAALAAEGLIDPDHQRPVWTGQKTESWRPCDVLGTRVWHEVVKQAALNRVLRILFAAEPVWIPIAAHRSALPTGPLAPDQDIFAGRHQDCFYNEGMQFTICWMPIRDVRMDHGGFAVAPGTHLRGILHDTTQERQPIPREAIAPEAWRSADFRAGDVLVFNYATAHTALPNPSDEIRMSLDVRAIPAWAPQPVIGEVEAVSGCDVTIRTEQDERVTVHLTNETLIRDMNPWPRIPIDEVERIAFPGAHVMAMVRQDGTATVLRRNFY